MPPTSTAYAQDLKLQTQLRQGVESASPSETRAPKDTGTESNTAMMLLGALAIMGVMVRRRWDGRN